MSNIVRRIKVTSTGRDPFQFISRVSGKIHFDFQAKLVQAAEATARRMGQILNSSGYNLKNLADTIHSEILDSTSGIVIGIGNISKFPKTKDGSNTYWEAFNSGFKPGASGTLVPLGGFTSGSGLTGDVTKPIKGESGLRWQTGMGRYTFVDSNSNKKPIEPLRFVDISAQELKAHIIKQLNRLNKEMISASK